MKKSAASLVLFGMVVLLRSEGASAHEMRLELGGAKTMSNRFNIPNPGGSRISVDKEGLNFYGRGQLTWQISDNGHLRLMVAPFSAKYDYRNSAATIFNGTAFPANAPMRVSYKFNSYRLGYLHRFALTDALKVQVGGIGKVRDARITVSSGSLTSTYDNVGFVPLLNFGILWNFLPAWELRFDIDGAAAKQGRAFDGMIEVYRGLGSDSATKSSSGVSAGVRVLEGGADNEKVNTFALIHYAFLAYTLGF